MQPQAKEHHGAPGARKRQEDFPQSLWRECSAVTPDFRLRPAQGGDRFPLF